MGVDVSGILYYGVRLDTKPEDYHDLNDAWHQERSPKEPADPDYRSPAWDVWRSQLRVWEATAENIEVFWSGSEDAETYYVHCRALEQRVEWDEQLELGMCLPDVPPEAIANIKAFCERFGLAYRTPSWHLACRYF